MITVEDRDKILAYLISINDTLPSYDCNRIQRDTGVESAHVEMILARMERMGLLEVRPYQIQLRDEIYEFHKYGGFAGQEEVLKANFEKLHGELLLLSHKVDSSLQMRISTVLEIMSSISNFLRIS